MASCGGDGTRIREARWVRLRSLGGRWRTGLGVSVVRSAGLAVSASVRSPLQAHVFDARSASGVAILANAPERLPSRKRREPAAGASREEASPRDRLDQMVARGKLGRRNERARPDRPANPRQVGTLGLQRTCSDTVLSAGREIY